MEGSKKGIKAIARNSLYSFSTWLLPLALSFIATPLIVRALGSEDYGIYALVLGFIAYSFNFNVGRAIIKYIAEFRAVDESEKISEVIAATLVINLTLGAIGLLLVLPTAGWLVERVFNIPAESQEKTVYAFYVAGLTIFFLMLNQVFNSILQGLHRFDAFAKISILNNLLLIAGNLFLAVKGFGLLPLLLWNLFVTALSTALAAILAKRLLPELSLKIKFRRETLKLVLKFSSSVIAYQILANILLLFERSWITGRRGAESLTFYVLPMMLALYIQSFISSLLLVISPVVSELRDEPEKLFRLYKRSTKIVCLLAVLLGTSMIVESRVFLTLWLGGDFAEKSAALLVLHTITFCLQAIVILSWQVTEGLGFPEINRNSFSICFVISVLGMVLLEPRFGNFGVGVGRMLGSAFLFLSIFYVEKRFFRQIHFKFWLRLIGILGVSAGLTALVENLLTARLGINWPSLICAGLAGSAVFGLTAWLLGFIGEDETALLKGALSRSKPPDEQK